MSQNGDEDFDPFHIGNRIRIIGTNLNVVGKVVYRDETMLRIMPQTASDRAFEYTMIDNGTNFSPELGVSEIQIIERQLSDYYVDFLGVKPGESVEFFTVSGGEAAIKGIVSTVNNTNQTDTIELTDGRIIDFQGIGPPAPIAVVRVTSAVNVSMADSSLTNIGEGEGEGEGEIIKANELLMSTVRNDESESENEINNNYSDFSFPESMQREDLYQDLFDLLTPNQKTNLRRIRTLEREVDLVVSLKNKTLFRDDQGTVHLTPYIVHTFGDAVAIAENSLPAAIPVVNAKRVFNIDKNNKEYANTFRDNYRHLGNLEFDAVDKSEKYLKDNNNEFVQYIYELLNENQKVLTIDQTQTQTIGWATDQDVLHTANFNVPVRGFGKDLPKQNVSKEIYLDQSFIISNVEDRSMRVITSDIFTNRKTGDVTVIASSDPSEVTSYMMIPPKAAMMLRPPRNPGDLKMSILYASLLESDTAPTITQSIRDLFSTDQSPLNVWPLSKTHTDTIEIADWLSSVLQNTVHQMDSLGPRTPKILSILDMLELAPTMSPSATRVLWNWISNAQNTWITLLNERRRKIQSLLDSEQESYTFVSESSMWSNLRESTLLKDVIDELRTQNPVIGDSPTLLSIALNRGEITPLAISEIGHSPTTDIVTLQNALLASQMFHTRHAELQSLPFRALNASPENNPCVHVDILESVRNTSDPIQRNRYFRDFVSRFQGARNGDWMKCIICATDCVCYHELMELEAITHTRIESIKKQILVSFGGERYEGKIVCRNCGQPLQDIDFDEQVEFDDSGRPIMTSSVLTEDQMIPDSGIKQLQFGSDPQRQIGDALQTILEHGGIQLSNDDIYKIVRYTENYVATLAPPEAVFKRMKQTGVPIAYETIIDQLRVAAIVAFTTIVIQTANPPIRATVTLPTCTFRTNGYPIDADKKYDEPGTLVYLACVTAFIQKNASPWNSQVWSTDSSIESRKKKVLKMSYGALQNILGANSKSPTLSITPEIRQSLEDARTTATIAPAALMSQYDELPIGMRPDQHKMSQFEMPHIEINSLPKIKSNIASGKSISNMFVQISNVLRQHAIGTIAHLHTQDIIPVLLSDTHLEQIVPPLNLRIAHTMIRNLIPTFVNTGTHYWPKMEIPLPPNIDSTVDDSVLHTLFTKYCYVGTHFGSPHEISYGNVCRQCGFELDKNEQQGDLRVEVTTQTFNVLSNAVRKRKQMTEQDKEQGQLDPLWKSQMTTIANIKNNSEFGTILGGILETLSEKDKENVISDFERTTAWEPMSIFNDELRKQITSIMKSNVDFQVFDLMTEDPIVDGPRAIQEYWCSKMAALGANYAPIATGTIFNGIAKKHQDMLKDLINSNSQWFKGKISDGATPIITLVAKTIGIYMRAWIKTITIPTTRVWTLNELQLVLRTIVMSVWRDALVMDSTLTPEIVACTRGLLGHVKHQFVRYSKDTIKRILQDRASLERDTIVKEFENIKDDDVRAAELMKKQFRIGRWAGGANLQQYDTDTFEFEHEQRKRMGIVDAPFEPVDINAVAVAVADADAPEDGYEVDQGADGDNY